MNVLHALAHLLHLDAAGPVDAAVARRRRDRAQALVDARLGPRDAAPADPDAAAFDAQCRRVRESSYLSRPCARFQVH